MQRLYTAPDGAKYPVSEAQYPMSFTIYRSCQNKAVIGDPEFCVIAKSIKKNPDVQDVWIGSGGHAYVVFKAKRGNPAHAVHFIIRKHAAAVRDAFDTEKNVKTQVLMLNVPTETSTLEGMAANSRARQRAVRNGAPVKKRGPYKNTRIARLGIGHRPRPNIKKGHVSVQSNLGL